MRARNRTAENPASCAVRHHYVPRGYLAPFTSTGATKTGRIWAYPRGAYRADVAAEPRLWLRPIGRLAEAVVPIIRDELTWRLIELPLDVAREQPPVTCDDPPVLVRPRFRTETGPLPPADPAWGVELGAGWREQGVQASLTLSPRHALLLVRDAGTLTFAEDPVAPARALWVCTTRHGLKWVYARSDDDEVREVARATPVREVQLVVDGVAYGPGEDIRTLVRHANALGTTTIEVRQSG